MLLQPPRKHRTLAWPHNRCHDCFLVKSATSTRHAYSPPAREVFCLTQLVRKQTQEGGPLVQVLGALGGEGYHPPGGGLLPGWAPDEQHSHMQAHWEGHSKARSICFWGKEDTGISATKFLSSSKVLISKWMCNWMPADNLNGWQRAWIPWRSKPWATWKHHQVSFLWQQNSPHEEMKDNWKEGKTEGEMRIYYRP